MDAWPKREHQVLLVTDAPRVGTREDHLFVWAWMSGLPKSDAFPEASRLWAVPRPNIAVRPGAGRAGNNVPGKGICSRRTDECHQCTEAAPKSGAWDGARATMWMPQQAGWSHAGLLPP